MIVGHLPDDIEQYLLDRQRSRATHALMARRGITLKQAREQIARWWLVEERQDDPNRK